MKPVKAWAVHCIPADTIWDTTFPTIETASAAILRMVRHLNRRPSLHVSTADYEVVRVEIRQLPRKKAK